MNSVLYMHITIRWTLILINGLDMKDIRMF